MAKRGADNQLSKDDDDRDPRSDGDESDPGVRAAALAPVEGRKIRGIPKRGGATMVAPPASPAPSGFTFGSAAASTSTPAAAPAPTAAAPKPSAFGGFTFGASTPAVVPAAPAGAAAPAAAKPFGGFSFSKPAVAPAAPAATPAATPASPPPAKKAFSGFTFGSNSSAPTHTQAAVFGAPAAVLSATPAATTAATITPSSTSTARPAAPAAPAASVSRSSSGPGPSQASPPDEGEVAYYTSLRGLNTSFLSVLSQSLNANEFLNLTTVLPAVLEQYTEHLKTATAKAGWQPPVESSKGAKSKHPNFLATATAASVAPAPAFSFSTPSAAAPPAPAAPADEEPATKGKRNVVNDIVAEALSKEDEQKKDTTPKPSSTPVKAPSSLFSIAPSGPLHPATPGAKTFAPSSSTTSAAPAQLGKFGPDGSTPKLGFGTASSKSFGTGSGFALGTSDATASPSFGFGPSFGASPAATSNGATAGSPAAKPFTFGTPEPASDRPASFFPTVAAKISTAQPPPPFTFGGPPITFGNLTPYTPPTSVFGPSPVATSGLSSGVPTPPARDAPAAADEPSKNLASGAGAGEEDEDSVWEIRGRLHALEAGAFKVVGLGPFKVKRSKDGTTGRLLMRSDGGGHVILNMKLQPTIKPTEETKAVKFIGADLTGAPKIYLLRVKTQPDAKSLVDVLLNEAADLASA